MNRTIAAASLWLLGLLAISLVGCHSPSAPQGKVCFEDGEPVRAGSIEFRSIENGNRYASRITSNGSFKLTGPADTDLFPPGDYEVVVVQIVITEDLAAEDHQHGRTVPRRYADYYTSGLRFTNPPGRTAPIEIQLAAD